MTDSNPNADSAKLLWNRLPGEYDLHRVSNYDQPLEGHELASSDLERLFSGRSVITSCAPTDPRYQYECLQTSELTYMVRKSGVPKKTTESGVLQYSSGEGSIWKSDSGGTVVGKMADLRVRHEIAPPVEPHNKKAWKASFRLVQEPINAGEGRSNYLDLCFFLGEESKRELCGCTCLDRYSLTQETN